MGDITRCHPVLQKKAKKLVAECKKQGIDIKIGECIRTVREQDALYAKGRTVKGTIVTNAKGSTYSSMHQWGIAFDFYLNEDVDKDGKTSDDAFNNSTGLFEEVGVIGKKIGLEWGGGWSSIKDRPHFQLPNWGSTTHKLKEKYKTPERFMATWKDKESIVVVLTKTYTVKSGDTLSAIATKYKTTVSELVRINGIKDPSLLSIGQKIKIK